MHNNKVVFILLDGLQSYYAKEYLGYLEHLCEYKKAAKYEVLGELPSASRPMYETIFTGVPVYEHGITNNGICRLSNQEHIFKLIKENHKKSLALAYYWISELYLSAPFNKDRDIYHDDSKSNIDHGLFYFEDTFPDNHLYALSSCLMTKDDYDFIFIHPMNIDDAGHKFGVESKEYGNAVIQNDKLLSTYIPQWINAGYSIIVGADHGMTKDCYHGGNSLEQRQTALYIIDSRVIGGYHPKQLTTLEFAPLLCYLLGIQPTQKMKSLEVEFNHEHKEKL